jgi:hypothetical protein
MIMETIDDNTSSGTGAGTSLWIDGKQCTLDGVPQASVAGVIKEPQVSFYHQVEFDYTFGDGSGVALANLRKFLQMDFSPSGPDFNKYECPSWAPKPTYGPSSAHPAVAIVAMGDGSVMAMNKRCDAANMFFLITKSNNDPFNIP